MELVVGTPANSSNASFQHSSWTTAFSQTNSMVYATTIDPSLGPPVQPTIDPQGHIYWNGEFSSALGEVDPDQSPTAAAHVVPLSNQWNANAPTAVQATPAKLGLYQPTMPFAGPSARSVLGEAAIYAGGRIWAIQGGGFAASGWNHSRIVSFNPTGVGDPSIPSHMDNRFCVYSVPGNNNEVYDLSWDGHRIWFAEFGTGNISWFDPNDVPCDTMLDYSEPDPNNSLNVAGAHQYCSPTVTAHCFHSIPVCTSTVTTGCLTADPAFVRLTADPDPNGGTTTGSGSRACLGSSARSSTTRRGTSRGSSTLTPRRPPRFPGPRRAPTTTRSPGRCAPTRRMSTWSRTATSTSSSSTNRRRPSTRSTFRSRPPVICCYQSQPFNGNLWLSLQDGWGSGSAVGFVNIASWDSGAPSGTIYTGLPALNASNHAQLGPSAFGDFAFNPTTGDLAVADYFRQQVLLLRHSPSTTILVPSNGATLTGTAVLDAIASGDSSITKVEFRLSGGTLNRALIGTATPTFYGWINNSWNSSSVPNGTYTLQSEAYDFAGNSAFSSGITVVVSN
jgi:hypothetical protein